MLFEDEDDVFVGSPRSKYFDIIFNASRTLSELELDKNLETIALMELLFEEMMGEDKDLQKMLYEYKWKNQEILENKMRDMYINGMGNILTQNE